MTPFDGCGYGRSMYWHWISMKEAVKTGESCTHLNIENLLIVMSPVKELGERIQFDIRCSKCEAKFPETSKKITEKFLEFYGLDKKNF